MQRATMLRPAVGTQHRALRAPVVRCATGHGAHGADVQHVVPQQVDQPGATPTVRLQPPRPRLSEPTAPQILLAVRQAPIGRRRVLHAAHAQLAVLACAVPASLLSSFQ